MLRPTRHKGAKRVQAPVQASIDILLRHPGIGSKTDDPSIRRMTTTPYPYLIFYEPTADEIIIHAIRPVPVIQQGCRAKLKPQARQTPSYRRVFVHHSNHSEPTLHV
jgi:plasmid stabilization system protein ParE